MPRSKPGKYIETRLVLWGGLSNIDHERPSESLLHRLREFRAHYQIKPDRIEISPEISKLLSVEWEKYPDRLGYLCQFQTEIDGVQMYPNRSREFSGQFAIYGPAKRESLTNVALRVWGTDQTTIECDECPY